MIEELKTELTRLGFDILRVEELYAYNHCVWKCETVNRLGVKPRGFFPWFNQILPPDHRLGGLERSGGSRSGCPQAPMPAVAPSEQREGC